MFVYTMKEFNAVVISLEAFKEMEIDFENAVFLCFGLMQHICSLYIQTQMYVKC